MGANDRTLTIVGTSHPNRDGTSRQAELALCEPGERVTLRPEPDNPYDEDAVAVDSARGVGLGYVSGQHTAWIGGKIATGHDVRAIVEAVTGGDTSRPTRGLLIRINFEGVDPDVPTAALTRSTD